MFSPYASPVLCSKEKGKPAEEPKAWRFPVDYRQLHAQMNSSVYPFPHIEKLLHKVTKTNFMSTLDLTTGYFQMSILDAEIYKTEFTLTSEVLIFKRRLFGLLEVLSMFQKMLTTVSITFTYLYAGEFRRYNHHISYLP